MQCGDLDSMVCTVFRMFHERPISPEFVSAVLDLPTHRVIKVMNRLASHGYIRHVTKQKVSFYKRID